MDAMPALAAGSACSPNVRCKCHSMFGCVNSVKLFVIKALIWLFRTPAATAGRSPTCSRALRNRPQPWCPGGRLAWCPKDKFQHDVRDSRNRTSSENAHSENLHGIRAGSPRSRNVRCKCHSIFGCVNSGKWFVINVLIWIFRNPAVTAGRAATFAQGP
jgi:hypothetical protein